MPSRLLKVSFLKSSPGTRATPPESCKKGFHTTCLKSMVGLCKVALSAVLFLFSICPLLWLLSQSIVKPGLGYVFAAADDIGTALDCLDLLPLIVHAFSRFEKFRGSNFLQRSASLFCVILLRVCIMFVWCSSGCSRHELR